MVTHDIFLTISRHKKMKWRSRLKHGKGRGGAGKGQGSGRDEHLEEQEERKRKEKTEEGKENQLLKGRRDGVVEAGKGAEEDVLGCVQEEEKGVQMGARYYLHH